MGAEPPLARSSSNNVVNTSNSWRRRVLLLPSSPLKPPFSLLSPISCLFLRDCHNKRLHVFFYVSDRLSLPILVVFCQFLAKNDHFPYFSEMDCLQPKFRNLKVPLAATEGSAVPIRGIGTQSLVCEVSFLEI